MFVGILLRDLARDFGVEFEKEFQKCIASEFDLNMVISS